jgi:hypothetical protein
MCCSIIYLIYVNAHAIACHPSHQPDITQTGQPRKLKHIYGEDRCSTFQSSGTRFSFISISMPGQQRHEEVIIDEEPKRTECKFSASPSCSQYLSIKPITVPPTSNTEKSMQPDVIRTSTIRRGKAEPLLIPTVHRPELGHLAQWSVSSHKYGFGVDNLRDGNDGTFWQSVRSFTPSSIPFPAASPLFQIPVVAS